MDPLSPPEPSDSDSDDQIAVKETRKTASEPEKSSSEPTKSSKTSATTSGVKKKDFCAIKSGAFGQAIDHCMTSVILAEDGKLVAPIDHWDYEKERLIFVMENALLCIKYNFTKKAPVRAVRAAYYALNKVEKGPFTYPGKSISKKREGTGVRVHWGDGTAGLITRWNPWSNGVPFWTFTSHPLSHDFEVPDERLNVESFAEHLKSAIRDSQAKIRGRGGKGDTVAFEDKDIFVDTYAGFPANVHNSRKWGFFKRKKTTSTSTTTTTTK